MTENPQKKKPLVIDSTDSSSLATPSATSESLSSDSPTISSSEETSISKSDEIGLDDGDQLLETEYKDMNCDDENFYSNKCNKFLLKKELLERNYLAGHEDEYPALYPNLNDTNFNIKIAEKKEDLAKQEAEIKKDEVLVNKEPSAVLNNAEQPPKPEVKAN